MTSDFATVLLVYGAAAAGTRNNGQANAPQSAAEAPHQENPSPASTPDSENASPKPERDYALYITVNGVKECVCTSDGHLTPKYKTGDGALPLVSEVFRALAPAANFFPYASRLGELTGDRFSGFKEATTQDNGAKKWILAEMEASIDFDIPNYGYGNSYGQANTVQDVAIVIELNPINIYILSNIQFNKFMSAGDVVNKNAIGVLWRSVQR